MTLDGYSNLSADRRKTAISKWVIAQGVTTKQLADVIGVPQRTVENWRQGVNAPTPFLVPFLIKAEPKLKRLAKQ